MGERLTSHNTMKGQNTMADDKAKKAAFSALAKAQSEMGTVYKDAVNPHFRSKYAGLPAILNEIIPTLTKHGFAFLQLPDFDSTDNTVSVHTLLTHSEGHVIEATTRAPIGKKLDPQAFGSAVTYLRRYAAQSMLGISTEDDDGNAASGGRMTPSRKAQADQAAKVWAKKLAAELEANGLSVADFDQWAEHGGRSFMDNMSASQLRAAVSWVADKNGADVIRKTVGGAK